MTLPRAPDLGADLPSIADDAEADPTQESPRHDRRGWGVSVRRGDTIRLPPLRHAGWRGQGQGTGSSPALTRHAGTQLEYLNYWTDAQARHLLSQRSSADHVGHWRSPQEEGVRPIRTYSNIFTPEQILRNITRNTTQALTNNRLRATVLLNQDNSRRAGPHSSNPIPEADPDNHDPTDTNGVSGGERYR